MFGIPTEIISMGASTLLGAWIKIKSQKSADRAAQHLQLINRHSTIEQGVQNARQDQSWGTVATIYCALSNDNGVCNISCTIL